MDSKTNAEPQPPGGGGQYGPAAGERLLEGGGWRRPGPERRISESISVLLNLNRPL
jgi:hypothetical protein